MERSLKIIFICMSCFLMCVTNIFADNLILKHTTSDFLSQNLSGVITNYQGIKLSNNLVLNPGFEIGTLDNWTIGAGPTSTKDSSLYHSGSYSYKMGNIPVAVNFYNLEQRIKVVAGHLYQASCWINAKDSDGGYARMFVHCLDDNMAYIYTGASIVSFWSGTTSTATWEKVIYTFTVPSLAGGFAGDCGYVNFNLDYYPAGSAVSNIWWDDIEFIDLTASSFIPQGYLTSDVIDLGSKTTLGKISWTADVPSCCTVTLFLRTTDDPTDVNAWNAWETFTVSGAEITSTPERYFEYKALLSTSDTSITPILKDVSIYSAVRSISLTNDNNTKYPNVIHADDTIKFTLDFTNTMDPISFPKIDIVPEAGVNTQTITSGAWSGNKWITGSFKLSSAAAASGGFAKIKIRDAVTLAGNDVYVEYPAFILIDSANIGPNDKMTFYPNPFSPNGDGKADEAHLFLNISQGDNFTVKIYNMKGILMRTLADNDTRYGSIDLIWDGKEDSGQACPVGLYLFQLNISGTIKTGTVVLAK